MEKKEKTAFYCCRKKAGIAQGDAAKLLGVTRTTLWAWETGQTAPDARGLRRMAEIYDCRLADLISEVSLTK